MLENKYIEYIEKIFKYRNKCQMDLIVNRTRSSIISFLGKLIMENHLSQNHKKLIVILISKDKLRLLEYFRILEY